MKIAYLNPWSNAAEGQAYFSLAAAGRSLGLDLVSCSTPEEVEQADPEFVLSVASSVPKVVDVPSYLTVHEPTKRFLDRAFYLNNLLSYDGFLTISDTLERFVKDLCFGAGRYAGVGFYYNSPQVSGLQTDLPQVVAAGDLRIVYIGTNWDRRAPRLLEALDERGMLRIHGPEHSWAPYKYAGYAGPLPWDGEAPQRAYSEAGIGLVLLSEGHLREDVISNRILEITSVGAVAICPRMPWIEKWYGDSVLYFTPSRSAAPVVDEITAHYAEIQRDPAAAQERAARARAVFEEHFAAERLLANAVSYHEQVQHALADRRAHLPSEPHVSVVVRCGARRRELVRQAVDSIRRQTYGTFTVIMSKYEEVDLSDITGDVSGRIQAFVEVLTPSGSRAATLMAGLGRIETEYFAILDDDDFWLSDHIETLFMAGRTANPSFDVAFSGTVSVAAEGTEIEKDLYWQRNIATFGFARAPLTILDVTSAFSSNCFIARTALLPPDLESLSELETAEDSLVVAFVARNMRPIFSYKPTAFFRRGYAGESNFASALSRERDMLSLHLRTGLLLSPIWLPRASSTFPGEGAAAAALRVAQAWRERGLLAALRELRPLLRAVFREPLLISVVRYLIGDLVVIARIVVSTITRRPHPSARKELIVSPLRAARRGNGS